MSETQTRINFDQVECCPNCGMIVCECCPSCGMPTCECGQTAPVESRDTRVEQTYSRFSVLSIWQRHLGAGCYRDETSGEIIAGTNRSGHRALDVDLYFYDRETKALKAFFEESFNPIEEKNCSMTKVVAGSRAPVYGVQSPRPPQHLYRCVVPDANALVHWALNQKLLFITTDNSGTKRSMDFLEFEKWREKCGEK